MEHQCNSAVATINGSGLLSSITSGVTTISYILPSGCAATKTVTVSLSAAPIGGAASVCQGQTIVLTDASGGGVWSSSNTFASVGSASGVVTGLWPGDATISYAIGSCVATKVVSTYAISPVTGGGSVCVGSTIVLNDATIGGSWSSTNTSVATALTAGAGIGDIFGVSTGTVTIIYTNDCLRLQRFCNGDCRQPLPSAILGTAVVCAGSTTTLTDGVSGGAWTTTATTIATAGTSYGCGHRCSSRHSDNFLHIDYRLPRDPDCNCGNGSGNNWWLDCGLFRLDSNTHRRCHRWCMEQQ